MHTRRSGPFVPVAGLISAALVTEARAHEHVLVDASAQAVDVGRHLVPGLCKGQNQLQSLGTVSGVIPPDTGSHGLSQSSACKQRITGVKNKIRIK